METNPTAQILVVDDEASVREALCAILEPEYRVSTAATGPDALAALERHPVDLATIDLNLPGMRGDVLLERVRREHPATEVVVITGEGTLESATHGIRHGIRDYLVKPFDVAAVRESVARALSTHTRQRLRIRLWQVLEDVVDRERDLPALMKSLDAELFANGLAPQSANSDTHDPSDPVAAVLRSLAELIEREDPYMAGHARRVAHYAKLLGERLDLDAETVERLRTAAFIHDIGKIGISPALLSRPGALDPAERARVERHPELGARLARELGLDDEIVTSIRDHHEWWHGGGYPSGARGEKIHRFARIIHLADAYDAITRNASRPYRTMPAPQAVAAELTRLAGVQFDPALVKAFLPLVSTPAKSRREGRKTTTPPRQRGPRKTYGGARP